MMHSCILVDYAIWNLSVYKKFASKTSLLRGLGSLILMFIHYYKVYPSINQSDKHRQEGRLVDGHQVGIFSQE